MTRCQTCGLTTHMHFVKLHKGRYAGFSATCPMKRIDSGWVSYGYWGKNRAEWRVGRSETKTGTTNPKEATEWVSNSFTVEELRDVYETVRGNVAA